MFFMGATPLGRSPMGNPNVEKEFSSFTSPLVPTYSS